MVDVAKYVIPKDSLDIKTIEALEIKEATFISEGFILGEGAGLQAKFVVRIEVELAGRKIVYPISLSQLCIQDLTRGYGTSETKDWIGKKFKLNIDKTKFNKKFLKVTPIS